MKNERIQVSQPENQQRRRLLQGAACIGVAGFAPAAVGKVGSADSTPALTGELICNISNPVKTLVLRNNSGKTIVVDQMAQGAFMFDGSIVDCNTACQSKSITVRANQEIQIQFDKRQQAALTHIDEFQRVQSRVARRGDGTRVIPFVATLNGKVATIV